MKFVNLRTGEEESPEEKAQREADQAKWKADADKRMAEAEERQRTAVPRSIETLRKEAAQKLAEADHLEAMFKAYPNLRRHEGRWKKVAYYTKDVNALVTTYDMRHNCGCCQDTPLEIWPYLETPFGKVYSDPASFMVGEKEPVYGGDVARVGWDKSLRDVGIPEAIIDRIRAHFAHDAEKARKYADEVYGREKNPDEDEPFI